MSAHVFPYLPGRDGNESRETIYPVTVAEAISGREDRINWSSTPRYKWTIRHRFLRTTVNCTVSPWTGYTELALVQYFITTHLTNFDSFHFADPYDTTDRTVRFVENTVKMDRIVPGVWSCEFDLISVI